MKIDKEAKHRFEYMAATICDKYCRYPLTWNEEAFGPLAESKTCEECPLTMFDKYVEVEGDRVPSSAREEAKVFCRQMQGDLRISEENHKGAASDCNDSESEKNRI